MKLVAHNKGVYMIECEKTFLKKVAGESDDTETVPHLCGLI
jgi:hypothetical protein